MFIYINSFTEFRCPSSVIISVLQTIDKICKYE